MITRINVVILCTLLTALPSHTRAQETAERGESSEHRPTRVPVTIALRDTTNPSAGYRILRQAGDAPLDVIILIGKADAVTLSDAISDLLLIRRVQGDSASTDAVIRLRRSHLDPGGVRVSRYPWAHRVVNDLRRADVRDVHGVGTVRAVKIWLPPQRNRNEPQRPAGSSQPIPR